MDILRTRHILFRWTNIMKLIQMDLCKCQKFWTNLFAWTDYFDINVSFENPIPPVTCRFHVLLVNVYVPLCSTGAAIVLCLHTHAIVPWRGWSTRREAHFVSNMSQSFLHSYMCVSMGMALNVTGALPINPEDLYVIDNNSVITGFYSILYMADCIRFIYQCMESVQCFLVVWMELL